MSETFQPLNGIAGGTRATNAPSKETGSKPTTTPAFEVLLERLSRRAAELEQRSQTFEAPEELPGVVDAARETLADAMALGNDLLEAYRAAQRACEGAR